MTTVPPLNLLDEPVRLTLVAACEALAASPGAIYPLVFVAPLRSAEPLRRAAGDAGEAFGIRVAEWAGDLAEPGPMLLICQAESAADAREWACSRSGVQVVAWSPEPVTDPGGARFTRPGDLLVDPRPPAALAPGLWLGASVEQVVRERSGPGNPLVVVCEPAELNLRLVEIQMYLEAGGLMPIEVSERSDAAASVRPGAGAVAVLNTNAGECHRITELAVACRGAGVPLVVLTGPEPWTLLRTDAGWVARVGVSSVVCAGQTPSDGHGDEVPWPGIPAVWVGETAVPGIPAGDALMIPAGTTLLEGLGYLEVRTRPGRLIAWGPDRIATIDVDHRRTGPVVVGVHVFGTPPCADRESALACLDAIRRWPRLHLAVVESAPLRGRDFEEPVQRVGFHLSRLDDERSIGAPIPAGTVGTVGVHALATALVEHGLPAAARAVLRRAERESGWGVAEEMLLGFLVAESDPEEAITRLRNAAVRLAGIGGEDRPGDGTSWSLQTDATLNALLLMVRSRQVRAPDAWASVEGWLAQAGTTWVSTARHAAVLFELAARSGRASDARRFAEMFRSLSVRGDPLSSALEPALASVLLEAPR